MFSTIKTLQRAAALFLAANLTAMTVSALEYVFPTAAKVVDITQAPYSADRTGKTDVSAILSKAANDIINVASWGPGILYMPNGTYLVKNTFAWKLAGSGNGNGPIVIGQSRAGTVIKLAKGTWPLGTELKGVIQTGAGVEQNFNKGIRNLTVLVDSNNAGAIGIIYVSNNIGMISDVDIISADGKGAYGIQSQGSISGVGGNGPFIIRRTYIKGFNVGMRAGGTQSEMMSQITLEGQSKFGIWVAGNNLTIDSLTSNDTCPAIEAQAPVMLTHGLLLGGSPRTYGIRNWVNSSFFSDIVTSGYKGAITRMGANPAPTGSSFAQHTPVVPVSLFSTQKAPMNLPTKYPPEVAWETDFTKWAFVDDYKTSGRNDVQAMQAAIDDPTKTTLCLAGKVTRQMSEPLYIRGNIKRIIGTGTQLNVSSPSSGQIIFDDGAAPVVVFQMVGGYSSAGETGSQLGAIVKRSSRTLVIESQLNGFNLSITGGGEIYVTDWTGGNVLIDNAQARVWMWQWEGLCCESNTFVVRNGMVRAVGAYDEGYGSMVSLQGGFTEILGYWEYATQCGHSGECIITIGNSANVSVGGLFQQNFCNPWAGYTRLVTETRNGVTKVLGNATGAGDVVCPSGGSIALFTAYDSVQVQNVIQTGARDIRSFAPNTNVSFSTIRTPAGIEVTYTVLQPKPVTLLIYDLSGRIVGTVKERFALSGIHRTLIPRSACSAGIVCMELRAEGKSVRSVTVPF